MFAGEHAQTFLETFRPSECHGGNILVRQLCPDQAHIAWVIFNDKSPNGTHKINPWLKKAVLAI
jgi:hypothetical protein